MTYFKKNTVLRDHPWYNMAQNVLSFNPNTISLLYILNVLHIFSWTLGWCLPFPDSGSCCCKQISPRPCLRASAVYTYHSELSEPPCVSPLKITGRIPIAHSSCAVLHSHQCCINGPLPTSAPILANAPFLGDSHPKGVRHDVV